MSMKQFRDALVKMGFERMAEGLIPAEAKQDAKAGAFYMPLVGEVETKAVTTGGRKRMRVRMTTPSVDRMGDVIVPSGVQLRWFKKNPVVLFAHKYDMPPVGVVDTDTISVSDKWIDAEVIFDEGVAGSEVARMYMSQPPLMRAWSVGFIPLKWDLIEDADEKRVTGYRVTKWELLELSAVPVPANPEALSRDLADIEGRSADEPTLAFCKLMRAESGIGHTNPQAVPDAQSPPASLVVVEEASPLPDAVFDAVEKAYSDQKVVADFDEFKRTVTEEVEKAKASIAEVKASMPAFAEVEAVKAFAARVETLELAEQARAKADVLVAAEQRRREQEDVLNRTAVGLAVRLKEELDRQGRKLRGGIE